MSPDAATGRGSRPTSPIADINYGVVGQRLILELQRQVILIQPDGGCLPS